MSMHPALRWYAAFLASWATRPVLPRRPRWILEPLEDRTVPATFDLQGTVLTVNGTAGDDTFQFSQQVVEDTNPFFVTILTFTMNGQSKTYTNYRRSEFGPIYAVTQVFVNGNGGNDTGILYTGDTHVNVNNMTLETQETAFLSTGGGVLDTDDPGELQPFILFNGFNNTQAYMGRADSAQLYATPQSTNAFVTNGIYSTLFSAAESHFVWGAPAVYGYSASTSDYAVHNDGSGTSYFLASGTASSAMVGTDQGLAFNNQAFNFRYNTGKATHAGDFATFYDSPATDYFVGNTSSSYMVAYSGPSSLTEFDQAIDFTQVYAYSFVGGPDYAYNHDPSHNFVTGFVVPT